ncbi:hypothetical protein Tco_0778389 [Tanacetum coccineum]
MFDRAFKKVGERKRKESRNRAGTRDYKEAKETGVSLLELHLVDSLVVIQSHRKCVGHGVVIKEIVEDNVVSSSREDSELLMIEWPSMGKEKVVFKNCKRIKENMSIGMERRRNGRMRDEKCTKLILQQKAMA